MHLVSSSSRLPAVRVVAASMAKRRCCSPIVAFASNEARQRAPVALPASFAQRHLHGVALSDMHGWRQRGCGLNTRFRTLYLEHATSGVKVRMLFCGATRGEKPGFLVLFNAAGGENIDPPFISYDPLTACMGALEPV